jgi:hypothetical protein
LGLSNDALKQAALSMPNDDCKSFNTIGVADAVKAMQGCSAKRFLRDVNRW